VARERAGQHAAHFRMARQRQVDAVAGGMDRPPIVVSPYDAELFGHWWYEGPTFLGDLFRQLHHDQHAVSTITPGDYLDGHPTNQLATPSASSWGYRGYNDYWCDESNAWIYRHLHVAAERMVEHRHPTADGPVRRALDQAARELLLMQASDWPFIMRTGTTVSYATRRMNEHVLRFTRLYEELMQGPVTESWLADVEARDNIFPDLDYRLYAS
jgi:1,4-alpha-glucan branching enzyme